MATIAVVRESLGTNCALYTWTAVATGDTGAPVELKDFSDASVQFEGTFGGATVVLQGSNDGTNFYTLTDAQTSAISKTSAALEQIAEIARYIRPSVSAGAGSINVFLYARRGR